MFSKGFLSRQHGTQLEAQPFILFLLKKVSDEFGLFGRGWAPQKQISHEQGNRMIAPLSLQDSAPPSKTRCTVLFFSSSLKGSTTLSTQHVFQFMLGVH